MWRLPKPPRYMLNDLVKVAYAASQTPVTKALFVKLWKGRLEFIKPSTTAN